MYTYMYVFYLFPYMSHDYSYVQCFYTVHNIPLYNTLASVPVFLFVGYRDTDHSNILQLTFWRDH